MSQVKAQVKLTYGVYWKGELKHVLTCTDDAIVREIQYLNEQAFAMGFEPNYSHRVLRSR